MEMILYIIILSLILNLIANMIWKYIPHNEKHIDRWVTGILVIICALLLIYHNESPKQTSPVEAGEPKRNSDQQQKDQLLASIQNNTKAGKLLDIIKENQIANVKESYGELAYQCFTSEDLKEFKEKNIPLQITQQLNQNNEFIDVILAIKSMPPTERQKFLESCSRQSKPTHATLKKISKEGQTDAGYEAEQLIAKEIVILVKKLSKLEDAQIKKLYQ